MTFRITMTLADHTDVGGYYFNTGHSVAINNTK